MSKIPVAEPVIGKEEISNVINAMKSGWISSKGEYIYEFEKKFAQFVGTKYGVATSNGTTALHLALTALGIRKGDEVIVPTLTFIATANAVKYCGAKPVFVDAHPEYWCIDPQKIEKKINRKTRAIIVVHLYGHPCDMAPILELAEKHNLFVIEDAAEAHGAEYKGNKVGSFGDIATFSFYGNKIITTGEGGMCVTSNEQLAEKMKLLRDHGMNPQKRYWHDIIGFNYRMTNIQAAIGVAQLTKINQFIEKKRKIAKWYAKLLSELSLEKKIVLHPEMPWAKNVFWMYSILINDKKAHYMRDCIIRKLKERGIETRSFFYPIHIMPPYYTDEHYPVAETLSKSGVNLPSGTNLSYTEILEVSENLISILEKGCDS